MRSGRCSARRATVMAGRGDTYANQLGHHGNRCLCAAGGGDGGSIWSNGADGVHDAERSRAEHDEFFWRFSSCGAGTVWLGDGDVSGSIDSWFGDGCIVARPRRAGPIQRGDWSTSSGCSGGATSSGAGSSGSTEIIHPQSDGHCAAHAGEQRRSNGPEQPRASACHS